MNAPVGVSVSQEAASRFWTKVTKGPGCWEWAGAKDKDGYGLFSINRSGRRAHRVAYAIAHGPIQPGWHVLHRCDNPGCVRPDHLWLGSNADNSLDRERKGRGNPPHGERNGLTRLTNRDAAEIRRLWRAGVMGRDLATLYGSSRPAISAIVNNRTFRVTAP